MTTRGPSLRQLQHEDEMSEGGTDPITMVRWYRNEGEIKALVEWTDEMGWSASFYENDGADRKDYCYFETRKTAEAFVEKNRS